ncbi:MAG: DUF4926 domain-containing protein [Nitrospira sp.]|nr:DUF4926 domain-containing protein [Nitrospira sp.]HBP88459.1 DUF4926 domain-containing protein [Nitrospiraceae bacterium]HNP27982.1 DUF4926 domain-containing protein [Nitrospirales bacterium]
MIQELEEVILKFDLPQNGLQRGDIGTVLAVHEDGSGYDVEFTALNGETIAEVTLTDFQVRQAHKGEIAHVRDLASSTL